MNGKEDDQLHSWVDPELEARLVALVLGEASDFEREELERLIEEQPELGFFVKRMEAVTELLHETEEKGGGHSGELEGDEWKLPDEKRRKLLAAIGGDEEAATEEDQDSEIEEPEKGGGAVVETIPPAPAKRSGGKRIIPWNRLGRIAAVLFVVGMLLWASVPAYHSLKQNESAAGDESAYHWAYSAEETASGSETSRMAAWHTDSPALAEKGEPAANSVDERQVIRRGTMDAKRSAPDARDSARSSLDGLRNSVAALPAAAEATGPAGSDDLMALVDDYETSNMIAGDVTVNSTPSPVEAYRSKVENLSKRLAKVEMPAVGAPDGTKAIGAGGEFLVAKEDEAMPEAAEGEIRASRIKGFAGVGHGGSNYSVPEELAKLSADAPAEPSGMTDPDSPSAKTAIPKRQPAAPDTDKDGDGLASSIASVDESVASGGMGGGMGGGGGVVDAGDADSTINVAGSLTAQGNNNGGVVLPVDGGVTITAYSRPDVSGPISSLESVADLNAAVPTAGPEPQAQPQSLSRNGGQVALNGIPAETPPVAMITVAESSPVALPPTGEPAPAKRELEQMSRLSKLRVAGEIDELDVELAMPEVSDKAAKQNENGGIPQPGQKVRGLAVITDGRDAGESNQEAPALGDVPMTAQLFRKDAEKNDASLEPPMPALNAQEFGDFDKRAERAPATEDYLRRQMTLDQPDEGNANGVFTRNFLGGANNVRGFDMAEVELLESPPGKEGRPQTLVDETGTEYLIDALPADVQEQVRESREQLQRESQPMLEAEAKLAGPENEAGAAEKRSRRREVELGMDFNSNADDLSFESGVSNRSLQSGRSVDVAPRKSPAPAQSKTGGEHGQITPIRIDGVSNTRDTVIRRELAESQQAGGGGQSLGEEDRKTRVTSKFVEVNGKTEEELGFDWLLNQPQADGEPGSGGNVVLGTPGGMIRNEGSITANTANGSGGQILVDPVARTRMGKVTEAEPVGDDDAFEAARTDSTDRYRYENLGVERQKEMKAGRSGQVSNGHLQAAEQTAVPQQALKGIEDSTHLHIGASADWDESMVEEDVERDLRRFGPAQHEWQRAPGLTQFYDQVPKVVGGGEATPSNAESGEPVTGLNWLNRKPYRKVDSVYSEGLEFGTTDVEIQPESDGAVTWSGSETSFSGNLASIDRQWKEGFGETVEREFIYPTEFDPPEKLNSHADINVNMTGGILIQSGGRHNDPVQIGHGGGATAWMEDRPLTPDNQLAAGGYDTVRGFEQRILRGDDGFRDVDGENDGNSRSAGTGEVGRLQGFHGNINVLAGNDVQFTEVGSRYGKTIIKGGELSMKQPAGKEGGYVQLGFRDSGLTFAANKVAPPAGLEEKDAEAESFSTFSLHVSDVSFKLAQAALAKGEWPEADKIRIEEFVNAFDYGDPMPSQEDKVACNLEQAAHPFLQQRNLLRVAMKTAAAGRAGDTPLRLTFLLDNSGSMERADRQETVRRAFALLADQLQPIDQVTLISFARQPRLIADKVSGDKSHELVEIVGNTPSEGGTNIEAALELAFEKAREQKADQAQNRIVLLTDGAANLGDAEPESLALMIDEMREAGIAFDAAGIGADGLNDEILEALTRKGDGRYYLLDRPEDADDGFARQIAGALRPAAKNVKVQVEFNPDRVGKYKLLGFEKHLLKKEDFRNDAVDAAEMAAEEAGVAVYQFEAKPDGVGDIGFVSVRFRDMSSGKMVENRWPIPYSPNAPRPDQSSDSLKIATAAAMLGAKLKGGPLGASVDLDELAQLVASLPDHCRSRERVRQLGEMIDQARQLAGK